MSETVYAQVGATIGIQDDDLDEKLENASRIEQDRRRENWHTEIQSIRKPSKNRLRNELIATYRKCYAVLTAARHDINMKSPTLGDEIEKLNAMVEQKHFYRDGISALAVYVAAYDDSNTMRKEIDTILRKTEGMANG